MIDDEDTPDARYLARRRREAWLVPLTLFLIVTTTITGIGLWLVSGDTRWLLLCAFLLLLPRQ